MFGAINNQSGKQSMLPPGNALSFDGSNDVVDLGNNTAFQLTQGTIEAWIKTPNAGDSWRGIVVKQMAYGLFMCNNELIAYEWNGRGNISTGVYLNDNKWHHVAFSFNVGVSNATSIYIDGVKKCSVTFGMFHQGVGLGIGNGSTSTNIQFFNGLIDDVRIWNTARTESQIQSAMKTELAGDESGLVAYYNFNQGLAGGNNTGISTVYDRTSNAFHGTLNNFAKSGSSSNFVESYALVVPTATAATATTGDGFTANWTAPETGTVSSYKLEVSTSPTFNSYVSGYEGVDCGTNLSKEVTGLSQGTTYYYRVRADKSSVTGCGAASAVISVSTRQSPTVETLSTTKISSSSISVSCNVVSDGGYTVTERGICWSTSPQPTISNNKISGGSGTGSYSCTLTNLNATDIYYVRAYATSSEGTSYGSEINYCNSLSIYTGVIFNNFNESALSTCYFNAADPGLITGYGTCWSTNHNPTISNYHDQRGIINGLAYGTTYYVRGFVRYNGVIFYGNEQMFKSKGRIYLATGSDDSGFDGIYNEAGMAYGLPYFVSDNGLAIASIYGSYWGIGYDYGGGDIYEYGYNNDSGEPPLSNWSTTTTLTQVGSQITYDNTTLTELASDNGSFNTTIKITHNNYDGNTFSGTDNEDFLASGKIMIHNLPQGLTASFIRTSPLVVTLKVTGQIASHTNASDNFTGNIIVEFQNSAFSNTDNVLTRGNSTGLQLDCIETTNVTVAESKDITAVTVNPLTNIIVNNNVTLNVNNSTSANRLTLNAGAGLNLTNTLSVNDVILKSDDSNTFSAKLTNAMTVNGIVTYEKTMLDSKWYFLSFPCDVNLSDISMNGGGALDIDYFILSYDGDNRARNGLVTNWVHLTNGKLTAKKGYAIGVKTGLGTKTLTFVLNKSIIENESETSVPAVFYDGSLSNNHKGWNLIGQPYLSKFKGQHVGINYITTWNGNNYVGQANNLVNTINPFEAFFVQVSNSNPISFSLDGRQNSRSLVETIAMESMQLKITGTTGSDITSVIFDNGYTEDYQIGSDLEKWLNTNSDQPQLYSYLNGIKYAYNALSLSNTSSLAVGLYSKSGGASTFSIDNCNVSGLSKLLLVDNKTGATTDLLVSSYPFVADAVTNNTRFNIIPQRISTPNNEFQSGYTPYAFMDNSTIIVKNVPLLSKLSLIDATGRMLYTTDKTQNETCKINLDNSGIYFVQIVSGTDTRNLRVVFN